MQRKQINHLETLLQDLRDIPQDPLFIGDPEEDKRARRWAPPKPVGFLNGRCHRVRVKLARILPSTAEESARANATQTK